MQSTTDVKNSQGLYAPTIRFYKGMYYIVCTNITQGNFIIHTENPENQWSNPVFVDSPFGIDPSLTFIDNHCYMCLSVSSDARDVANIDLFEINAMTGKILSKIITISNGCGGRDVEAPHVYRVHGIYYLILAEGGTREGHMVTIQKSNSIFGPYSSCPNNPILTNRNVRGELQNVGHADLVQGPDDNWWLVALAVRQSHHYSLLGRETILLPVDWLGVWPIVNNSGYATVKVNTDKISGKQEKKTGANLFTKRTIRTLGLPVEFSTNQQMVTMKNYPRRIEMPVKLPISFISISQMEFKFKFSATLNLNMLENGEFGLVIYKDDRHRAELLVEKQSCHLDAIMKCRSLDLGSMDKSEIEIINGKTEFCIQGNPDEYFLSIKSDAKIVASKKIATRHFTSEVADSMFTGVQIGLYANAQQGYTQFQNVTFLNE